MTFRQKPSLKRLEIGGKKGHLSNNDRCPGVTTSFYLLWQPRQRFWPEATVMIPLLAEPPMVR